jgi:hypothetical protein
MDKTLIEIHDLPVDPAGYGDVSYRFDGVHVSIDFEYQAGSGDLLGHLRFEHFIHFCIESEQYEGVVLPERSGVIYETAAKRKGFRKFIVWLSNNHLVTVECSRAFYENIEL